MAPSLQVVKDSPHRKRDPVTLRDHSGFHPNAARILWDAPSQSGTAIVERGRVSGYDELREKAAAVAGYLTGAGLEPGDRVGIFHERGPDAAAAFFGVVAAGGVAININETLRPRQIEHILSHAEARHLLAGADLIARQPRRLDSEVVVHDTGSIPMLGDYEPVDRVGPDVAQIIYTSGSTGLPKGVAISHANLWAGVKAVTAYVGITATDRIASLLPFSFDYGFNQLLCSVAAGATLVIERSPLPQQVVDTLRDERVTVLPCVPPLWLQLLGAAGFRQPLPSLRAMTNTGGRIPVEAVRDLRRYQPQADLFLMYGLTEAFRATYLPPAEVDRRPDSIGRAIPGSEIMVLREDGTPCGPGEVGELVQRGTTVALGYWNDPEATARVYRPNPIRPSGAPDSERVVFSGDLVRQDEEGFLYFVGRRDRMIKSLGYRVSPDEIVDVLYASGEVAESVVVSEPDDQRGERIVALVVLREHGSLDRLERYCRLELPRYMQPARLEARRELPRTASGKHDARAAAEQAQDHGV